MRDSGGMEFGMEKAPTNILMVTNIWDLGSTIKRRAEGHYKWKQETRIQDNGNLGKSMEEEDINLVMRISMKENSWRECVSGKENTCGLMEATMMESGRLTK